MTVATRSLSRWGLARPALVLLFLAMAGGQLSDLTGFVDILDTYRLGGRAPAAMTAIALLGGELIAAVGLLSGSSSRRHRAGTVAVAVAVAWTVLAVQAFARGLEVDNCGCFGVHAGQTLRWWVLLQDVWFVALAWWVRRSTAGSASPGAERSGGGDDLADRRVVAEGSAPV